VTTGFLPVDDVLQRIMADTRPIEQNEVVSLEAAHGRILANDVISALDVPAHPNSAMDGFAFCYADYDAQLGMEVLGSILAGQAPDSRWSKLPKTSCLRIMTGAVLPPSCDTVVPQEHCQLQDGRVHLQLTRYPLAPTDNTRAQGEDLRRGQAALSAGRVLTAADIGLLASLGVRELTVKRRLRLALLSTGNELVSPGEPLSPGKIYDSNRFTLKALLQELGAHVVDLGIVADDPEKLEHTLRSALQMHQVDAIISSGGVSVGEADFTKTVMARLGRVSFWQIAMRPGRPLAFGNLEGALYFGLPGNPVAVMMTYYFFARPALLRLQGATDTTRPSFMVRSEQAIRKKPGRTEYQRAILTPNSSAGASVRLTGQQGSGVLSSMSRANCLVVLDHEQGNVKEGELVQVLPFKGLF
jgi:molybdopterin molybdotransferase